ncbi:MAG: CBS domain-containing protein [Actinobacteria bacterium]|nr:CBS domain-containing protein [Actinomycetota bacterium]
MKRVGRDEVLRLLDEEGAQLVDVRGAEQYGRVHLPGALNVPLAQLGDEVDQLDPSRPVVVSCSDARSDLSARAAARLEDLGIGDVHRYVGGLADWRGAGLPTEGREGGVLRAGTIARRDVPTARTAETMADVAGRVGPYRTEPVVVVDDDGVVLGLLPGEALHDRAALVADLLEDGPVTVRADEPLHDLAALMLKLDLTSVLVTDPDGRLLGLARRDDVERLEHND